MLYYWPKNNVQQDHNWLKTLGKSPYNMQLKLMTFLKRYKTTVFDVRIDMRLKSIHKGHIIRMQLFSLRPPST